MTLHKDEITQWEDAEWGVFTAARNRRLSVA